MNIDFKKFKEHCVEYHIFDSYQYAEGMIENIRTANYCLEMINTLISYRNHTHLQFQEKISQSLSEQLESNQTATVGISAGDLPNDNFEILGLPVSCAWLLEKYIKDYFQYIRNAYDSIAQVINFALIAGDNNLDNEWVDFGKVKNKFSQKYKAVFPLTEALLEQTSNSLEYSYICDYNNRTKHIKSVKTKISNELFGDGSTYKLLGFEKKDSVHSDEDIQSIIRTVFDFTDNFIDEIFKIIIDESKQKKYTSHRIQELKFYSQSFYNDTKSSFTNIFIKAENSISELPDIIEVLAIRTGKDIISASNVNIDVLLVCTDEGKNPMGCVGQFVAEKPLKNDGLYHYRRFIKDENNLNNTSNYFRMMNREYYPILNNSIYGTAVFVDYPSNATELDDEMAKKMEKIREAPTVSDNSIMSITFEKSEGEKPTE